MKELTIEEKAKAYDEALKNARYYHSEMEGDVCCVLEECFPQLKDEIMRSMAIKAVSAPEAQSCIKSWGINPDDVIAWLEKQGEPIDREKVLIGVRRDIALSIMNFLDRNTFGMCLSNMECVDLESAVVDSDWSKVYDYMKKKLEKQCEQKEFAPKSAMETIKEEKVDNANKIELKDYNSIDPHFCKLVDKIEPKFHEGNWIISHYNHVAYIKSIDEKYYFLSCNDGNSERLSIDCINRNWRLWDIIKDAKNGDVLYSKEHNLLWLHKDSEQCHFCINLNYSNNISIGSDIVIPKDVQPATKEQRDTLERAMTDAGYTFDFKKKELKKTNPPVLSSFSNIGKIVPAEWSEDRSKELSLSLQIQAYLSTARDELYAKGKPLYSEKRIEDINKCILMWVKLHNAYFYQKSDDWGEEDERLFQIIIDILDRENHLGHISHADLIACVRKLKSLRPQT